MAYILVSYILVNYALMVQTQNSSVTTSVYTTIEATSTPLATNQPTSTIAIVSNTTELPTTTTPVQSPSTTTVRVQTQNSLVTTSVYTTIEATSTPLATNQPTSTIAIVSNTTELPTTTTPVQSPSTTTVRVQIEATSTLTATIQPTSTLTATIQPTSTLTATIQPTSTIANVSTSTEPPTTNSTPTPEPAASIEYMVTMILMDKSWNNNYLTDNSSEFETLINETKTEVEKFFSSTEFRLIKLKDIALADRDGKVNATFTVGVSLLGGDVKHKDPVLHWKERVDKDGKIGSLTVNKEWTKLLEKIPPGTTVSKWTTKAGECDTKCGGPGPVAQDRVCSGAGCRSVLTTRWVTCDEAGCSTGPNLVSSLHLVIATLLMRFLI